MNVYIKIQENNTMNIAGSIQILEITEEGTYETITWHTYKEVEQKIVHLCNNYNLKYKANTYCFHNKNIMITVSPVSHSIVCIWLDIQNKKYNLESTDEIAQMFLQEVVNKPRTLTEYKITKI